MNKLAPFTHNQVDYFRRCGSSWFNVAEGGKRGGKNVLQTLAFCTALEVHPNKLHLIGGVSQATAKLNIMDCDGFGLMNFFEGRCHEGKFKDRACLYVQTKTGEKIVLVSGGAKSGDEKYIKGNTYGMAYITEANECHPSFIKEVFDRTLSSSDRKIFHDLNPKASRHWYYTDVLEFHEQKQAYSPKYGYNYGHFTIADNLSIDDAKLRSVLATYKKGSLWYVRDILGQRKNAEGLIYELLEHNRLGEYEPCESDEYYISCDYGTNNPFAALLWAVSGSCAVVIGEYYYSGKSSERRLTDEQYCDAIENLAGDRRIERLIVDPSAASFIQAMRKRDIMPVREAKNDVLNGIRVTASLILRGKIAFAKKCKNTFDEFDLYSWNPDSAVDEPIKDNDHCMDAMRYFCYTELRYRYGEEG